MKNIKYKEWLSKLSEKDKANVVQIRMMSSGNNLAVGIPPAYGVYLAENKSDDEISARNMAAAMSSLGGGNIMSAPIEFYVRKAPLYGHVVKRAHNPIQCGYRDSKIVGYGLSLKSTDRVAYSNALKTGRKLASLMGIPVVDQTSQDLSKFADKDYLKLEERVHNFKQRIKSNPPQF